MSFGFPSAFLLFIPLILYFVLDLTKKKRNQAIVFSSLLLFGKKGVANWRTKTLFIPQLLFFLSLILGIIALAAPQKVTETLQRPKEGIAIELVFDRSSSMETVLLEGIKPQKRLLSAQKAVTAFVFGDEKEGLGGRPNDLVGLITFARYPDTLYPLSVSHTALRPIVESIETSMGNENEDGTNIGDAVALAAARLKESSQREDYKALSQVIILLTDGENNVGEQTPLEAAQLAKEWGIRIYCIYFGGRGYIDYQGQKFPVMNYAAGFQELQEMATLTGGEAYGVESGAQLLEVYKEIDELEKSPFEVSSLTQKQDYYRPFLWSSLLSFMLSLGLSFTLYRRSL